MGQTPTEVGHKRPLLHRAKCPLWNGANTHLGETQRLLWDVLPPLHSGRSGPPLKLWVFCPTPQWDFAQTYGGSSSLSDSERFPSHCGITFEEQADRAAKRGAVNSHHFIVLNILLSSKEARSRLEKKKKNWNSLGFIWSIFYVFSFEKCSKICLELNFQTLLDVCTQHFLKTWSAFVKNFQQIIFYTSQSC